VKAESCAVYSNSDAISDANNVDAHSIVEARVTSHESYHAIDDLDMSVYQSRRQCQRFKILAEAACVKCQFEMSALCCTGDQDGSNPETTSVSASHQLKYIVVQKLEDFSLAFESYLF
jgi:hypothetical protein